MKLRLDGRVISYRRRGAGPPILWIHAFPFSRLMWEDALAVCSRSRVNVAIDLPGFGGSTALLEEEASMAAYAEACEAVAAAVNPNDPWIVAGLSMGGYVAFELVRRRRLRLGGLVLADTRAAADTPEGRAARLALLERAREEGADAVAQAQIGKMLTADAPAELRSQVYRWMRATPQDGLLGAIRALAERPDSTPTLAAIDVPTLAIVGEEDPISPPDEMEALAKGIAGARLVRIAGASHLSNVEQPEAFHAAVLDWLGEQRESADDLAAAAP